LKIGANGPAGGWRRSLESFVAELTEATYPVVLRHGLAGCWVDLELDIQKVLYETLEKKGRQPPGQSAEEFEVWRGVFLSEMTRAVYSTVLRHGLKRPLIKVELDIYRALRSIIRRGGLGRPWMVKFHQTDRNMVQALSRGFFASFSQHLRRQ
jgi:hypothetical protein